MRVRTPYRPVLRSPALRRLLPGLALSAVGDGMRVVTVAWLALDLAPPGRGPTWVAVCSAAAVVPGLVVALLAGRVLGRRSPVALGTANALLHAAALGVVPVLAGLGLLDVVGFALMLGVSSLLGPWGGASQWTLLARVLDDDDRVAGNAAVSTLSEVGTLVGPAFAALLIGTVGPVAAVGVDAVSFLALAVGYRAAGRHLPPEPVAGPAAAQGADGATPDGTTPMSPASVDMATAAPAPSIGSVLRRPELFGVLALTWLFFALYGPVDVGLPVHVRTELGAPVSLLSAYVVVFGAGAVVGGVAAGWLGRFPAQRVTAAIVLGWGVCLLPLGLGLPQPVALAAFGLGAFVYAPYLAVTTALVQRLSPPDLLPRVLALRSAVLGFAVPLGAVAAGPLVTAVGGRRTILASAMATVTLGLLAAAAATLSGRRPPRQGPRSSSAGSRRQGSPAASR